MPSYDLGEAAAEGPIVGVAGILYALPVSSQIAVGTNAGNERRFLSLEITRKVRRDTGGDQGVREGGSAYWVVTGIGVT